MPKPESGVTSFETGLAILEAFERDQPRLGLVEIARRCRISRFAARRYLQSLIKLGYAGTDGRQYFLTHRVLRVGSVYLSASPLVAAVQPLLLQFTARSSESAYLWVQDGDRAVVIAKATPNKITNRSHSIGAHFPLFVTSAGMVIAAHQAPESLRALLKAYRPRAYTEHTLRSAARLRQEVERAREQGWFVSERQLDDLVRGIAVPLLDASGQFVGAVSTNLFVAGESTQAALARLLGRLQDVAQAYRRLPVAAGAPAGGRAP